MAGPPEAPSPLPEGIFAEVLLGVLGVRSPCMEVPREAVCGLDTPRRGWGVSVTA